MSATAMDRPHICQHCSATFLTAGSLRTHAAHIHGEGLQAFLAENSRHSSRDLDYYGDTSFDVKPSMIKIEVCDVDGGLSNTLATDAQAQVNDTTGNVRPDVKPDMIKREVCEAYRVQSSVLRIDTHAQVVSDLSKDVTVCNNYGAHADTTVDAKPPVIKREVWENEWDSIQSNSNVSVTDTRVQVDTDPVPFQVVPKIDEMEMLPVTADVHESKASSPLSCLSHSDSEKEPDFCDKSLNTSSNVKKKKRIRAGVFTCTICSKTLKSSYSLKLHVRAHTDSEYRPFECSDCKKSFRFVKNLKIHKRTHTGERPYVCKVCNKAYNRRDTLTMHERLHTGVSPYVCDVCEKSFISSCSLKTHKGIHTGVRHYICNTCKKNFHFTGTFRKQEPTNPEGGPWLCPTCKDPSIPKKNKLCVCKVCNETFQRLCDLRKHQWYFCKGRPRSADGKNIFLDALKKQQGGAI